MLENGGVELDGGHEGQTSALAARRGSLLLDYLRVRLVDDPETWAGLAVLGSMTSRAGGWRGWYDSSAIVLEGGIVAWCRGRGQAERQGIVVDLPGRACAAMGDKLLPFFEWALERGKVTRVDFAIDDRAGRLTLDRILQAETVGGMVSRWHGITSVTNRRRGVVDGWTVYMGSRSSEALVRVYDKAAEQKRKGRVVAGHWVRLELEAHQAFADALCRAYFREGSAAVIGQIARRVRFAEPAAGDSNPRRWPVAAWWAAVLGSVEPGPSLVTGEVPQCTVERVAFWVERQSGPALAMLVKADRGDFARVSGIVERGQFRLKPKHRAALVRAGVMP